MINPLPNIKNVFMDDEYFKNEIRRSQKGYNRIERKYKKCEERKDNNCEMYKAVMEMLSQRIDICKMRQLEKCV